MRMRSRRGEEARADVSQSRQHGFTDETVLVVVVDHF